MPFEYINRKDRHYYIRVSEGKHGKPRYTVTSGKSGVLAEQVPEGYEVHEIPENAQVVLRKKMKSEILELEREALLQAVQRQLGNGAFIVDREEKALVVYLCDIDEDNEPQWLRGARSFRMKYARLTKMMRFELDSTKPRKFTVSRWCFLGSIDHWIRIGRPQPLAASIDKYVPHLGKHSFFTLI